MMHNKRITKRAGAIWPLLLGCLALMLAGVALAVDSALLWQARQELQVAADASALAAIQELADDQLLLHREGYMQRAVRRSMVVATEMGLKHNVLGLPQAIEAEDEATPDVVVGFHDPAIGAIQPAIWKDWDSPFINSLQVTARRTRDRGTPVGLFFTRLFRLSSADVTASATAVLDRHIIGFRPNGQINIPLMPIGLLSDPTGIEETSWEAQIDKPLSMGLSGIDQHLFDKTGKQWYSVGVNCKVGDGLPEFTLKLPLGKESEEANGVMLQFGKQTAGTTLRQMESGLTGLDLQAYDGRLELGWDGMIPVEEAGMPAGKQLSAMIDLLNTLHASGEARIWPLYLPGETGDEQATTTSHVMIRGFISARIAKIEQTESYLEIELQPTVMVTGTALTHPEANPNAYLGKIKLIR
ncbi:MAG TPA: pilus assembly protein TadG-related protein [Gemmatales bacterium]|nr:pilus assembly protein TadG-related protein [Gemmatales bacterium]